MINCCFGFLGPLIYWDCYIGISYPKPASQNQLTSWTKPWRSWPERHGKHLKLDHVHWFFVEGSPKNRQQIKTQATFFLVVLIFVDFWRILHTCDSDLQNVLQDIFPSNQTDTSFSSVQKSPRKRSSRPKSSLLEALGGGSFSWESWVVGGIILGSDLWI